MNRSLFSHLMIFLVLGALLLTIAAIVAVAHSGQPLATAGDEFPTPVPTECEPMPECIESTATPVPTHTPTAFVKTPYPAITVFHSTHTPTPRPPTPTRTSGPIRPGGPTG